MVEILNAGYKVVDLAAIAELAENIKWKQNESLLKLLHKFEPLFEVAIGDWITNPFNSNWDQGPNQYTVVLSLHPISEYISF